MKTTKKKKSKKKSIQNFRKLSEQQIEKIWRLYKLGNDSPTNIAQRLDLPVSPAVVRDILHGVTYRELNPNLDKNSNCLTCKGTGRVGEGTSGNPYIDCWACKEKKDKLFFQEENTTKSKPPNPNDPAQYQAQYSEKQKILEYLKKTKEIQTRHLSFTWKDLKALPIRIADDSHLVSAIQKTNTRIALLNTLIEAIEAGKHNKK